MFGCRDRVSSTQWGFLEIWRCYPVQVTKLTSPPYYLSLNSPSGEDFTPEDDQWVVRGFDDGRVPPLSVTVRRSFLRYLYPWVRTKKGSSVDPGTDPSPTVTNISLLPLLSTRPRTLVSRLLSKTVPPSSFPTHTLFRGSGSRTKKQCNLKWTFCV